jgi:hypothetical protein
MVVVMAALAAAHGLSVAVVQADIVEMAVAEMQSLAAVAAGLQGLLEEVIT